MVNRTIADAKTSSEADCIEECLNWLSKFVAGEDRLVVDDASKILNEYYDYVLPNTEARRLLRRFHRQPYDRMVFVRIEYDSEYAKLPDTVNSLRTGAFRVGDRRLIAVALACEPRPPIINATDSDWSEAKTQLENLGIVVQEICSVYVQETLQTRT